VSRLVRAAPAPSAVFAACVALGTIAAGAASLGCKGTPSSPAQGDSGTASSDGLTPEQSAQVLARVGDRTITLGDYVAAFRHMDQFDRLRYEAPERRRELLGEMIDVMLLADEARAQGYDKDPITEQEIREILRDAYLDKAREGAPTPADIPADEVRAYYDAHRADFHDPERRRLSVIVLSSQSAATSVLETAKKTTAAQWGEIVRAKSADAHAKANVPVDLAGDLGFVSPPGDDRGTSTQVPEEVRAGVFEIAAVGDVLPRVVASGGKFYIVRFTSKADARDRSVTDAERSIRVKLAQEKLHARQEELIDDLRKQYPVQIDEAALATVKVDLPPDAGSAR
jgi:peptidyl-prolyl cis-trans isomerase C